MSVTTTTTWQSIIHSTTVIFSPEAREEVFQRFRSSPTVHSASLSYDAEENWFEIACLANDTDNASKTLALIISTFSAADPANSKDKIDVFPESVVDWRKWRRQLDQDDEEQENCDETREDLIDFGQASERREWIPADPNVDLDVLLPPSLLQDVAQLTGCELDRSITQQVISIVPGPAGNSAAAARKLTNIEEEKAQKYPVVSHVLRTQKVDRFGVLFMPILDLESSSAVLDGTLTRMLFTPSSPLTLQSHGRPKAKRFSKFHVARLFKQGQLQPRNVKPLEPKGNGLASRVFRSVNYIDIGDEPPGEVAGSDPPALRDPAAKTIENWIDDLNVTLPPVEEHQIGLEEVRSVGSAKDPPPASAVQDSSSQDIKSVITRQETVDHTPSWDKAPVRPSPISAVQHTINWDGYEQPGKIPHKFPPLPQLNDDEKRDTAISQTQQPYQVIPGTRNAGRIELVMPQRGGYQQPVRGGSRTSRAGIALNQRGGTQQVAGNDSHKASIAGNVHYRQASKASQRASSRRGKSSHPSPSKKSDRQPWTKEASTPGTSVHIVAKRSAATPAVPVSSAPTPSTALPRQAWSKVARGHDSSQMRETTFRTARTDPFPRIESDVSREIDEADDEQEEEPREERRFISTLLKAPALAGRKKPSGSQKKQPGVGTRGPLAHLKEQYQMQPRPVKKRAAFSADSSEDLINMNSSADERDVDLSADTISISTFPSSTGATSSSAASQIHADLQGLNIGCRMDATTKKSIQATHQGLGFARSFQGKIEVVAQVGQVILTSLSPELKKMMNQDSFVPSVRMNEDETMFKSLEGNFTSAITATMSDMDSLLDFVGVRSTDKPYEARTLLNFECVEPDKSVIHLSVPGDTHAEQPRFVSAPKLFGSWYAHHPQRVWDSRIVVTGQTEMDVDEREGGLEFVNDLYVRKQEQCIGPDIQGCDDNGLELRAAQIHTLVRYSLGASKSLLDGDDDSQIRECYIELKRVLDLQIFRRASTTDAESRVFFAQCLPESEMIEDQRLWYEVSFGFVRSPPAFEENAVLLELGDKAAWKPKDALTEHDLLGLHDVATRAVEKMDNVGARNRGLGARYEQREKNKSSDTATRAETFW